jgi:hypothetical protein
MLRRFASWVPALAGSIVVVLLATLANYQRRSNRRVGEPASSAGSDELILRWLLIVSAVLLVLFTIYFLFGTLG